MRGSQRFGSLKQGYGFYQVLHPVPFCTAAGASLAGERQLLEVRLFQITWESLKKK